MKRFLLMVAASAVVVGCSETTTPLAPGAPEQSASVANSGVIPGRFIVTLREDAVPAAVASAHGVRPDYVYSTVLSGFAGAISEAARSGLLRDARVLRIEPDGIAEASLTSGTQAGATWGLDRIDARAGLNTEYSWVATGAGVTAYVIDTGIRYSHTEFAGRASFGYDAFGGTGDDCNGHGTHVAGTIGGATYGVAREVELVAVRVLDCGGSGTWSGVIAGMDWVADQVANLGGPAVANMSLGGGASLAVDQATQRLIAAGVTTSVAAGNGNAGGKAQDACYYSPARVPEAITVGATTSADAKTSFSNYGACVDWFAPGSQIKSAWYTSTTATNTISGTSMAAPHVAGVAALYLERHPTESPQLVRNALYQFTTKGIVSSAKTANNHLLYSREEVDSGTGTTPPPTCKPRGASSSC